MPAPAAAAGAKAAAGARGAAGAKGAHAARRGAGKSAGQGQPPRRRKKREPQAPYELPGGPGAWIAAAIALGMAIFLLLIVSPILLFSAASADRCAGSDAGQTRFGESEPDPPSMAAMEIAARVFLVGRDLDMGRREILTAFAVVLVESGGGVSMRNPWDGDRDSVGAFQQRDLAPWNRRERRNVAAASKSFYEALISFDRGQSPGELAADIQRPAKRYRARYALAMPRAREFYTRTVARLGVEDFTGLDGLGAGCGSAPAELGETIVRYEPRRFRALPADLMASGRSPQAVDARIWGNVVWVLRTYELRVSAARERGHRTHGDGTAIDAVPAAGNSIARWDRSAKRLAQDLGWSASCAGSGSRPACGLVGSIQFVGYNGYDRAHGDPAYSSTPHIHVSWGSSSYGTRWGPPPVWVKSFPARGVGGGGE